jgi:hypothetical protein
MAPPGEGGRVAQSGWIPRGMHLITTGARRAVATLQARAAAIEQRRRAGHNAHDRNRRVARHLQSVPLEKTGLRSSGRKKVRPGARAKARRSGSALVVF